MKAKIIGVSQNILRIKTLIHQIADTGIKTENLHMVEEKKSRTEIEKNLEHLRYRLIRYKIVGIAPPVILLIELKMAENLLNLESIDTYVLI
jgi:hypothetical protein